MQDIKKTQFNTTNQTDFKIGKQIIIIVFVIAAILILKSVISKPVTPTSTTPSGGVVQLDKIKKFSSEGEFKDYLQKADAESDYFGVGIGGGFEGDIMTFEERSATPALGGKLAALDRVSQTNVQVTGIDEPDIVKTDGKEIYISSPDYIRYLGGAPMMREMSIMPPIIEMRTKAVKAFPPADLKLESEIEKSGNLLLDNNNLVIFSGQDIYGYDVSNPNSPEKKWDITLENNNYLVDARLYKNKIYLVTRNEIDISRPCPIIPLKAQGESLTVRCEEIYHSIYPIPVNTTFIAMILNPASGKIEEKVSFIGSAGTSVIYMSENAIYITYPYHESIAGFFSRFLKEKGGDMFPAWVIEKMDKLENYDISQSSKMIELQVTIEKYFNSLDDDERLRIENEMENRISDYYEAHKRELDKIGIVKIQLDKFDVSSAGSAPGSPLNQFSLDEYKNNLRIAVTIGDRWGMFEMMGESVSDVYILDENLKIQGSVKDLGKTERIFSVRFAEDKGYVVTFRQTDPFYVLDLSNPQKPELKGELKIPGYSSYLHPITKDKILGVGKQEPQIKISLFDVSDPQNPTEADKYILDEYWSDILNTQHAFLLDDRHKVFFMPGGKGGYIFSYENDKLKLVKAVSQVSALRAIYINDYLYIVGNDKITVLNENDWQKVNELDL